MNIFGLIITTKKKQNVQLSQATEKSVKFGYERGIKDGVAKGIEIERAGKRGGAIAGINWDSMKGLLEREGL